MVSVSGKLSRLLKGRFSGLLSLSSSDEEGSRWFVNGLFFYSRLC